jgi:hypothetical protein
MVERKAVIMEVCFGRVAINVGERLEEIGTVLETRRVGAHGPNMDICEFFQLSLEVEGQAFMVSFYFDPQRGNVLVCWENCFPRGGRCCRLTQGSPIDDSFIARQFDMPWLNETKVLSRIINAVFRGD